MFEKWKIVMSNIWEFVLPFLRQLMSNLGSILMKAALSAVKNVSANVILSSEEKRRIAFNAIKNELCTQGITIGVQITESMVNAAIEIAVQKMKDEKKSP